MPLTRFGVRLSFGLSACVLTAVVFGAPWRAAAEEAKGPRDGLSFTERKVAGGPDDFMEVRHLVLRGSNVEIGRRLAELARERHGATVEPSDDPLRTRAQRRYFQNNFPTHFERMRGVAAAFAEDLENDRYNFASLPYGFSLPGCSVVYYPPSSTTSGVGVFSRNYDFTTGTFRGLLPTKNDPACTSRPYVLEMYPDSGYASLAICAYDLLGGVIDGINSEGLTVALLADDELAQLGKMDPARGTQAGLEVIQVTRFLLDTCANVEEAKVALRAAKLYYGMIPCHYVVADRHGASFLWENAASMHYGHVIDGKGGPQVVTNFLQHLHPEAREGKEFAACARFDQVRKRLASAVGKVSIDFIKETSSGIAARPPVPPAPRAPHRTLWHALYYPEQRRMEVDFYLGESPVEAGKSAAPRRSGYLEFKLDSATAASR